MLNKKSNKATVSQIERWRQPGSAGFLAFLADVEPRIPSGGKGGGFIKYTIPNDEVRAAIERALDGDFSTVVFSFPRRHGKTVLSALIIVWRFLTRRTQNIGIVANSERQSVDTAFRAVKDILQNTPYTASMVLEGVIKVGADRIEYAAVGNSITGYAASAAALFGKRLSVAAVSELHAAKDDAVFQVVASSTVDSEDGLVLIDSTVGPRSSPLHMLYELAQSGEDPTICFCHLSYKDLEDAIRRGPSWIKPEKLRSRARQMLEHEFLQQHCNQWTASSANLFTAEIIAACCAEKFPTDVAAITSGAAHIVGGGLDRAVAFSKHGDASVTTAVLKTTLNDDTHYYVLASDKIAFSSEGGIKAAFSRYRKDFGMSKCSLESFNSSDIQAWATQQPWDSEMVHPTIERQASAFTALFQAAKEGRLHVHPSMKGILGEMEHFEYQMATSNGKTVPKFEHARGKHDDHLYSLAWAVWSLRDTELNPYEVTGIHCDAPGPVARLCILNGGDLVPACSDTCRSFASVDNLYKQYRNRSGITGMPIEQFFASRVVNIGSHTVKR